MNKTIILLIAFMAMSCAASEIIYETGDLRITVKDGSEWLHNYGVFQKNPPQFAVWAEDMDGKYLGTLIISKKIAVEGWIFNGGSRRKESLPCWAYKRGVIYDDGLYMPTRKNPVTDGITTATPVKGFEFKFTPSKKIMAFRLYAEFNHSTDFNASFPEDADKDSGNYSGGKEGSGQPSIIYTVSIDLNSTQKFHEFKAIGHGSPSGINGNINPDLSGMTTAMNIIERITVEIK